jgi:hypothetical protein
VHEQRRLARRRRALERRRRDTDDDPAAAEVREHVTGREGTVDRVELVPVLDEAGRGGRVQVGTERDHHHVGLERAGVGLDAALQRIDGADRRLDELHTGLDDVAVGVEHGIGLLAPEHHVELREPEHEALCLVDEDDLDVVAEPLRQRCRQLEPAEPGAEHQHLHHALRSVAVRHRERLRRDGTARS